MMHFTAVEVLCVLGAGAVAFAALRLLLLVGDMLLRQRKLGGIPMVPGSIPLLGHVLPLLRHPLPWELMLQWMNDMNSDVIRWYMPFEDWLVVRGGEAMRTVFQTKFRDFHKEMAMSFHPFLCILGTGLVTSHGELWQQQRKLMTPAFKGDILEHVIDISLRAVGRIVDKFDKHAAAGSTVEVEEELRLTTLQVITEAMMSLPHEESDRVFPRLYLPIMREGHKRVFARWREFMPFTLDWWRHRSNTRNLDRYICGLIQDRWNELSGSEREDEFRDLLDLILVGKKAAGQGWSAALQTQLCFELKTFLLAGHETSAAMLTLTLLELISHEELRSRVLAEADAALGPDGTKTPTREDVEGMAFTLACLQETLRKYSVVPVLSRVAVRDTEVCGCFVPAGTKLVVHVQGTHEQWDCPHEYRPARFLPGGEFERFPADVQRFMFVPFGQGPRVCIGQHFSLMESRVVLAALLQRYSFELQRPYALEWISNIIPLQPQGGVPVGVARRKL